MTKGKKDLAVFKRLNALKCLKFLKFQKIPNPPLVSYLFSEPNFSLIK
jgi:hypothetical protein